jgi:hypothetical protein
VCCWLWPCGQCVCAELAPREPSEPASAGMQLFAPAYQGRRCPGVHCPASPSRTVGTGARGDWRTGRRVVPMRWRSAATSAVAAAGHRLEHLPRMQQPRNPPQRPQSVTCCWWPRAALSAALPRCGAPSAPKCGGNSAGRRCGVSAGPTPSGHRSCPCRWWCRTVPPRAPRSVTVAGRNPVAVLAVHSPWSVTAAMVGLGARSSEQ